MIWRPSENAFSSHHWHCHWTNLWMIFMLNVDLSTALATRLLHLNRLQKVVKGLQSSFSDFCYLSIPNVASKYFLRALTHWKTGTFSWVKVSYCFLLLWQTTLGMRWTVSSRFELSVITNREIYCEIILLRRNLDKTHSMHVACGRIQM